VNMQELALIRAVVANDTSLRVRAAVVVSIYMYKTYKSYGMNVCTLGQRRDVGNQSTVIVMDSCPLHGRDSIVSPYTVQPNGHASTRPSTVDSGMHRFLTQPEVR
jgi:hypothetical protein